MILGFSAVCETQQLASKAQELTKTLSLRLSEMVHVIIKQTPFSHSQSYLGMPSLHLTLNIQDRDIFTRSLNGVEQILM